MKIGILSRRAMLYSTRRLVEAAKARGHQVRVVDTLRCYMDITTHDPAVRYKGEELTFDAVIPRIGASITFYGTAVVRPRQQVDHPRLIRRLDTNPDVTQVFKPWNFQRGTHNHLLPYHPAAKIRTSCTLQDSSTDRDLCAFLGDDVTYARFDPLRPDAADRQIRGCPYTTVAGRERGVSKNVWSPHVYPLNGLRHAAAAG